MKIVAEAGACNNSVKYALKAVEDLSSSAVWAMKVQMYRRETLTTSWAKRYDNTPGVAPTQYELFSGAVPYEEWRQVAQACYEAGIEFFASVFDVEAIAALYSMGAKYVKIASGDITNQQLIQIAASTGMHVILSTGASTLDEVARAVEWIDVTPFSQPATILACALEYPAHDSNANLGRIATLRKAFPGLDVGYSDHTYGVETAPVAAALGATMLEKHYTLSRNGGEGDHSFAATSDQLDEMAYLAQQAEILYGNSTVAPSLEEMPARIGARRSLVSTKAIEPGEIIDSTNTIALRPGDGIPPHKSGQVRANERIDQGKTIYSSDIIEDGLVDTFEQGSFPVDTEPR